MLSVLAVTPSASAADEQPIVAVHPTESTPAPSPSRNPLLEHITVRADGTFSFLVGSGDKANLFQPTNYAANAGWMVRYENSWQDGFLKIAFQRLYTNDVQEHFLQTVAGTLNAHSVKFELDTYEVRREWDTCIPPTCDDAIDRIEAAVGFTYNHPGPQFVGNSLGITGSYRAVYALVDYYFGAPLKLGFDGYARHFDVFVQGSRGTHSVLTANGMPDAGAKGLYSWSPTYSFLLRPDGRTYAYINYSNAAHVYDGIAKPLHTDDFELGLVRQASRNLYIELHLNSLTKQGTTAPQYLPYSLDHSGIDLVLRFWLNRPS